jgi:hypothetical protein
MKTQNSKLKTTQDRKDTMKRLLALVLVAGMAAPACAARGGARVQVAPTAVPSQRDRVVLTDFARQIPAGTRVRATTTDARTVRGTLLKTTGEAIFIQPRARVPEPLVEVPFSQLIMLEPEPEKQGSSAGRSAAIGASVGAGAALGTLFILAALIFGD